jgi:glycosyltransferase involved in cell wall biosynthesis
MLVTVVICTWNRAELLEQTLTELRRVRLAPGLEWELLVVNNNCTDETDKVLKRHDANLPLRRLFEARPGKSFAANLAVDHAKGELIVWTDDDVLVDPDWLLEYVKAAEQWPWAAFFGGTIDPWFAAEPPRWIHRHIGRLGVIYAARQLGSEIRPLADNELPFGANMAVRRQVFATRRFNTRLGPCGRQQVRGEETELLRGLRQLGKLGVWVGTARVRHYIPAERLKSQYVWDWYRGSGRLLARQQMYEDCKCLWGAPRWAIRKYWSSRVQAWCLAAFQGSAWLGAFTTAATCRGIIEETRAAANASRSILPTVVRTLEQRDEFSRSGAGRKS